MSHRRTGWAHTAGIQHIRQAHAKAMKKNKRISGGLLDLTPAMEKRRTAALMSSPKTYQRSARNMLMTGSHLISSAKVTLRCSMTVIS